jgi:hypothetical protein
LDCETVELEDLTHVASGSEQNILKDVDGGQGQPRLDLMPMPWEGRYEGIIQIEFQSQTWRTYSLCTPAAHEITCRYNTHHLPTSCPGPRGLSNDSDPSTHNGR